MNSITSDENDTSDDDDLFVTVIETQNTKQVDELWDRTWAESEDDLKVAFLYHYFSLHLGDELFYLIDPHGESHAMTWNDPTFSKNTVHIKIFDPQEAYSLSTKEMKSEIYKCHSMILGGRLIDKSGTIFYNPLYTLQFNYSITPIKINLSELYDIKKSDWQNYFIALSDKIYQKQKIPEEKFTYIDSIKKCQLFALITISNIDSVWREIDKNAKAQCSHMKYIVKLMHHILSQSVLTPSFDKIILLTKLALNILPLDYNEKINFIETNIKETQLNFNDTAINQWLNKNKKLYFWASNYIVKRVKNQHLKNIILQTSLCNSDRYNNLERSQFKSLLELINNYNVIYKNTFNFSTFTATARTKSRRSKDKPRKKLESSEKRSMSISKENKTPSNKKNTTSNTAKKPLVQQRVKKPDLSSRKLGCIDDKTLERLNTKLTKTK